MTDYFKVSIQYLQKSDLVVAAKSVDEAKVLVAANITEGTAQFAILDAVAMTDEEKKWVLQNMQGFGTDEPSGEVQDTRTLN